MLGFTISIVDGESTRHTVVTRYHKLLALLLGCGARIKENWAWLSKGAVLEILR